NRLVREKPDKAREYGISDGVEIDFDDWVQLYFQDLDFLVGRPLPYVHYTFKKRNEAIQRRIEQAQAQGKT
ncbi:MAG: hypothetical protein GWM98_11830, partial [Nitrospinaceae bacterium]|nr:hypothetical protein [Nitrospinaceae bacterium]NIR55060.1 hypothetical protein [Nitrospinaceae bacterium]NIS85469.1 hypothetical protein [Nitrospinaceae bacterium]NIT82307.1 hypothetical protein [Nitrospinaceae bacterium]NIU44525.1 hypothetical protein [Nitrospinaceae bacterium]